MTPQHGLTDGDNAFRNDFEEGRIAPGQFDHRAHVRLAYVYLAGHGPVVAPTLFRAALMGFLEVHGIPRSKYHETLTEAWLLAVAHFMRCSPGTRSAEEFIAANPKLLDSKVMLSHYSASVLFSDLARTRFVEPDLTQIPRYPSEG